MNRRFFVLLLLFAISLITINLQAQSGRKGATQPTPKPGVKTDSPSSTSPDSVEGITESRTIPGGETVEGDVIRVDTSLVTVPVTVMDRYGRYVPQLRLENFRIFEAGVDQKLAYFATSDQPFTVILVIDTSGSTQFRLEDIQDAAITFVGKLKPDDSVMVMSFDDRIDVQIRPTTDRNEIARAIRRTRTGGGTRLYDAVDDILNKQLRTIAGRKAVVLFTDGVDTTSRRATYDTTVRLAEESEAPIYSVDYDTSGATGVWGGGMPGTRGGIIFGIPGPRQGGSGIPGSSSPGDYRRATASLQALRDNTGG